MVADAVKGAEVRPWIRQVSGRSETVLSTYLGYLAVGKVHYLRRGCVIGSKDSRDTGRCLGRQLD